MRKYFMTDKEMVLVDWLFDIVIALGAFGLACLQLNQAVDLLFPDERLRHFLGIESVTPSPLAYTVVALSTLPLAFRRKFPIICLVVVMGVWGWGQYEMTTISMSIIGPLIVLFSVCYMYSWVVLVIATAFTLAVSVIIPVTSPEQELSSLTLIQNVAFIIVAAVAGYALHVHREYLKAAQQRAEAAERTRETEASRRVEEERVRIAREVHDITAHSLSAVSIQAAAAEALIDTNPDAAKQAIREARSISKNALDEIRAMIGVLRSGNESAETQPVQGCDRMGDLVSYLEGAGIETSLEVEDYDRSVVPAFVDVALFGIAREATTNIVRHANAKHATIELSTTETDACLKVSDDGAGLQADRSTAGSGHGIKGMEERVNLLHGTFEAKGSILGGFVIEAAIPLSITEG
ncbi:MAG: sensor histidine kinase [Eggerthellaceae bacterium]|nr:sensor histidine kinase [Eggerthellaceae bacterium]